MTSIRPARLALTALLALPCALQAAEDKQAPSYTLASAEAPSAESLAWNKPAQLAYFKSSDAKEYYNVDVAFQVKKQIYAVCDLCVHSFGVGTFWQRSTAEKSPFDNRGLKFSYVFFPATTSTASNEYRLAAEIKLGDNDVGKLSSAGQMEFTQTRQNNFKLAGIIDDIGFLKTGYTRATGDLHLYSDYRSKSTATSGNGAESGTGGQIALVYYPLGLENRDKPNAFRVAGQFKRQVDFHAGGNRTKDHYKYFLLEASIALGTYGDKGTEGEQWRPSLAVQRTGGQDVTTGLPRRYVSQLAIQLRYSKN
jgi:hypothetical protein